MRAEDVEIKVTLPAETSEKVGIAVARRVLESRGNHSEAHLSEVELAVIIAMSIELVFKKMVVMEAA